MIGAKGALDILNFSAVKSIAKLNCPGMTDIVRLRTDPLNDFIGCSDSDGNFSSYRFESSYSSVPSLLLRKTHVS
jgi:hypothetical protein